MIILVIVPFFWPVLVDLNGGAYALADSAAYGIDPEELKIWFGILALVVVELGLITPPVGLNVFIISSLAPTRRWPTPSRASCRSCDRDPPVALLVAVPAISLTLPRCCRSDGGTHAHAGRHCRIGTGRACCWRSCCTFGASRR